MKAILITLFFTISAFAGGPQVWSVNTRAEVLKGDARGVSIDENGTVTLAPKLTEVFKTGQQYIWSGAVDPSGNVYLGTGGDGKVLKVDASGKGSVFADLAEMNVTSLAISKDGSVFAGTSPDGKVYRMDSSGKAEIYFEPKEKYIWSLVVLADGLAVGTGDGGKIYKVRSTNASPEASLLFDTSETHIISLVSDKQGNLFAGTDSNGLVMRFGADGKPFGLLDSSLREIHALSLGPDGSLYVLALGESASAAKPAEPAATASAADNKTVSAEKAATQPAAKSRYDLTGAKSAVYRILPDGSTDILWTSTTVTGFSLYAHKTGSGVLVGTSDKGRIYNIGNDGRETLALQTDASQISTVQQAGQSLVATSSNQGSLFRFGPDPVAEGTYESPVLDAKTTATWGRIWWRSYGMVSIQTRSGNTDKADETWSAWSEGRADQAGMQITSPRARFLQWRAVLKPMADISRLLEVNVAFIPRNIAPEVLSINILPTNVGLAANPPAQIDPNIVLSGMDPASFGIPVVAVAPRKVYQRGATSLQWTGEDRNGDKLVYDVYYKHAGDAEFKLLRGDFNENFISIDGQSLTDGQYVFKIVARDTPSNPASLALSGDRLTESIDIDNTPPTVTPGTPQVVGDKGRVAFDATDAASYLTRAEYSINGGEWTPVYADDSISDSPRERYTIEIPLKAAGEYAVTIRVYDVNGNSGNARAVLRR